MDAAFFLRRRTSAIRRYYTIGVEPFREIQRKIGAEESPYDEPPQSFNPEDGEPAFVEEWIEANEAAQIVGWSAVSLLSDSLKLYLRALERQLGFRLSSEGKKVAKQEGFLVAYKGALGEAFGTDWSICPVRFDIIEQIVLARNRTQHGTDLIILSPRHDIKTLMKHRDLLFASPEELKMWIDHGGDPNSWSAPRLEVTAERLAMGISEVEKLADWIDERMPDAVARRYRGNQKAP